MNVITSGNMTSSRIVTQAYLNITQNITQGITNEQLVNIDCGKDTSTCLDCVENAKKYGLNVDKVCNICFCRFENIDMENIISIDFDAFLNSSTEDSFQNQIENSLTQNAVQTGTRLFNTDEGLRTLSENSNRIYNEMRTESFQTSLQELRNFQVINMVGQNSSIINVDMDIAIEFISAALLDNTNISNILNDMQTQILQMTTEVIKGGFSMIISWIVTIVTLIIIAMFFLFGFNLIMQVIQLYSSS